jgi:hypothetical protein
VSRGWRRFAELAERHADLDEHDHPAHEQAIADGHVEAVSGS